MSAARQAEKSGDLKSAEKLYQKIVKAHPAAFTAFDRLMVIYRKQKELSKELETIDLAIGNFKKDYLEKQQAWIAKNEAAAGLSRDLAISLGLMDHEGLPVSADPQLSRWLKRKELLLRRSEKKTNPAVQRTKALKAKK